MLKLNWIDLLFAILILIILPAFWMWFYGREFKRLEKKGEEDV